MRDTLILNADIRSMVVTRPQAEALLIRDGRIAGLGTTSAMRSCAGPNSRVIDAGGRLVLPGFQDAHVHLLDGGTDLIQTAALAEVTTVQGLQAALAAHAAGFSGELVMGGGWRSAYFGDHNLTRQVLDAVVPDRPCIAYDDSGHNACLNSRACQMAAIWPGTADPPNGHLVRDAAGEPTGMLHEEAIPWARKHLPQISGATFLEGARAGQAHANRHGITGVLDPSITDYHERAYGALAARGAMNLRVSGAAKVLAEDSVDATLARLLALRAAHHGAYFHINSAKFFLDGVLENRTAAMIEPYADATGGNAATMFAADHLAALFTALDAARFQLHVHVIGDGAARAALDGFQAALRENGPWPSLHQLAHLQVVHEADFARIAALGAMANVQPLWAQHEPGIIDPTLAMIGPAREPLTYAFRRMLDAGAPYCLSSDWSVTTLNPFEIIETAVTRQPSGHAGTVPAFHPRECLTVAEAVLGYTAHAAAACWRGHFTGRLLPGFSADLIVLDRNILTCDPGDIGETEVMLTLFEGREVHRHPAFEG